MKWPITNSLLPWVLFCVGALAMLPALLDRPEYRLYLNAADWTAEPGFFANGEPSHRDFPASLLQSPERKFWRNWSSAKGVEASRIESAPFVLKTSRVVLPIYGLPNSQYAGVYLEAIEDGQRYHVGPGASHEYWKPFLLQVPQSLVGEPVRIVGYSENKHVLVGIGTPYYQTNRSWPGLAFSKIFGATAISLFYLLILFYPLCCLAKRLGPTTPTEQLLTGVVLTAVGAFLLFFVGYYFPNVGRAVARSLLLLSGAAVLYRSLRTKTRWTAAYFSLVLLSGLTLFHGLFLFSFRIVSVDFGANYLLYPASWSTDNQIPPFSARLLADGALRTGWPFIPWTVSDRTPLLSALLYPAAVVLRDAGSLVGPNWESMVLQIAGFGLQNLWVLPIWCLFRRLRLQYASCVAACLVMAATPFVFFNSVYIWPKLLSGTFTLALFWYLTRSSGKMPMKVALPSSVLGGLCAGLAVLSHTGAAFGVFAVFAVIVFRPGIHMFWRAAVAAGVSLLLLAPWIIWTKYEVPTINPLPKYFLTGSFGFDRPTETVTQATRRVYGSMTAAQWVEHKTRAVTTLGGFYLKDARDALGSFRDPFTGPFALRGYQFFALVPALGLLLIPLGFMCFRWLRPDPSSTIENRALIQLASAALIAASIHLLVMLAPHLLHHYPYFVPLALQAVAIVTVFRSRSITLRVAALINYLLFLTYWLILPAITSSTASVGALTLATGMMVAASIIVCSILLPKNVPAVQRLAEVLRLRKRRHGHQPDL